MSKQFVKISKAFGFNRNRLVHWQFTPGGVVLQFDGAKGIILTGSDLETFRNWTENEAEPAPETYQYTLYGQSQVSGDQKQNSEPGRGK